MAYPQYHILVPHQWKINLSMHAISVTSNYGYGCTVSNTNHVALVCYVALVCLWFIHWYMILMSEQSVQKVLPCRKGDEVFACL